MHAPSIVGGYGAFRQVLWHEGRLKAVGAMHASPLRMRADVYTPLSAMNAARSAVRQE